MSLYLGYVIEELIHEDEKLQIARARRRKQRRASKVTRARQREGSEDPSSRRILGWSSLAPKH